MKKRLKDEGNQTVTNCNGFKMQAPDGKMRKTDCADNRIYRMNVGRGQKMEYRSNGVSECVGL